MNNSFKKEFLQKSYEPIFFNSQKTLFLELKKFGSYDFFLNHIFYAFCDCRKVCKVLKKFTEGNKRKMHSFSCV